MTPWTVARQAPLFMGVLQAGILEWLLCPLPGELPNPGIKTRYLSLQVDSLLSESPGKSNTFKERLRKAVHSGETPWDALD